MGILELFQSEDQQNLDQINRVDIQWDSRADTYCLNFVFTGQLPPHWLLGLEVKLVLESGKSVMAHLEWLPSCVTAKLLTHEALSEDMIVRVVEIHVIGTRYRRRINLKLRR